MTTCDKCGEHCLECRCPTEITSEDIDKAMESLFKEPRKCSCGNGFPAKYEVSSQGQIWDLMCIKCFQELTKDGQVIQIGNG